MTQRVMFLNPPSYEGFDGGAGSRYQARREVRSFWYPTWLAQAAALCPQSKVLDAPAEDMTVETVVDMAGRFNMIVIYTSTPGYANDARIAQQIKRRYPDLTIGMVGPHCTVLPEETLQGCDVLDFVARKEFDFTILEIAQGKPFHKADGISYIQDRQVIHNPDRTPITDMDRIPSVLDIYQRDLAIENYFVGYLLHPYLSVYTGRGCPGRCTFCLWPQTIGGRTYRTRSVDNVLAEMQRVRTMFPQVREIFFDDDTFTANPRRAEAIAGGLKKLGLTWSCSARANVSAKTLAIMKASGLRCLMVGVESGNDQILKNIKKGITTTQMRTFFKTCRELNISTHATFVLGLPGETRETVQQTIAYAKALDPDTLQVSIATPYPGTELYEQAVANGWFNETDLVSQTGVQQAAIEYSDLTRQEIFDAVETFYNQFYLRPKPVLRIIGTMLRDKDVCMRRLREAREFFSFMHQRKRVSSQ